MNVRWPEVLSKELFRSLDLQEDRLLNKLTGSHFRGAIRICFNLQEEESTESLSVMSKDVDGSSRVKNCCTDANLKDHQCNCEQNHDISLLETNLSINSFRSLSQGVSCKESPQCDSIVSEKLRPNDYVVLALMQAKHPRHNSKHLKCVRFHLTHAKRPRSRFHREVSRACSNTQCWTK
jgi:hypothetical protein